ncbi:hypothetical protein OAE41_00255 [bacterium]|nr:hypothetical protein [bacterium]
MTKFLRQKLSRYIKSNIFSFRLAKQSGKLLFLQPIASLLNYIVIRQLLTFIDIAEYGVWSSSLTLLSWMSLLDLGVSASIKNKITVAALKHDKENLQKNCMEFYQYRIID